MGFEREGLTGQAPGTWRPRVKRFKITLRPERAHGSHRHSSLWRDLGSLGPNEGNEVLVDKEDKSQAGNLWAGEKGG